MGGKNADASATLVMVVPNRGYVCKFSVIRGYLRHDCAGGDACDVDAELSVRIET